MALLVSSKNEIVWWAQKIGAYVVDITLNIYTTLDQVLPQIMSLYYPHRVFVADNWSIRSTKNFLHSLNKPKKGYFDTYT